MVSTRFKWSIGLVFLIVIGSISTQLFNFKVFPIDELDIDNNLIVKHENFLDKTTNTKYLSQADDINHSNINSSDEKITNVGEILDVEDTSFQHHQDAEVISIGEYIDVDKIVNIYNTGEETISVGEFIDIEKVVNDYSSNPAVINLGKVINIDNAKSYQTHSAKKVQNIGEYEDVDNGS